MANLNYLCQNNNKLKTSSNTNIYSTLHILHYQEINLKEDSFKTCKYLNSQFNILANNAINEYGSASFVKTDFEIVNHKCETQGRALVFSIGELSFGNVYLKSGTDNISRNQRENYCSEVIPQLLLDSKETGVISGDWNCITEARDCTKHPDAKKSPCLKRLMSMKTLKDTFRTLHPDSSHYSRYYSRGGEEGPRGSTGATAGGTWRWWRPGTPRWPSPTTWPTL